MRIRFHAYPKVLSLLAILFLGAKADAQTLVHYWTFNDTASQTTLLTPKVSLVTGASISHIAGGTSVINKGGGTGQNYNVSNLNARTGDTSGTHLRFENPIGGQLVFAVPTTGYNDPIIKFATRRSGQGAGNQYWEYTTNGTTYIPFDTVTVLNADPVLEIFDFSSIAAADNNPNFKLRVNFAQGGGGTGGNNRFDNFTLDATAPTPKSLVHYWNFNNISSQANLLTPTVSLVAGATINHIAGGSSAINISSAATNGFEVANVNARNSDTAGTHLRFDNPVGGQLEFVLPTTGYEDAFVKFTTRRSGSGASLQYWSYSTNGTTFVPFDTIVVISADPVPDSFDFSGVTAVDNNPNFKLRVNFGAGTGGTGGNNRFDNFTLDGYAVNAPDTVGPSVVFNPLTAAQNVLINANPTITFSELVRLVNNSAITNANAATLVELKLNNATGAAVPFTASYVNKVLTITPASPLTYNQQYYVALLPNVVEDTNNNAVTTIKSAQFTTIMQQTSFSAGDMAFVAYRMNATGADDEIALVTFVDILPGTFINLTDAKYTSNAQAQCSGGIVWTAPTTTCIPAGSLITIKTEALTANRGTVTGSGFGLSSSGDQVIVYTGSASSPNYITALTSNGWLTTNTTCSGSASMIPATLTDGVSAANLSTAPGNVAGNTVNAYYNGTQTGAVAVLKAAILNPANWTTAAAGTNPQTWPAYNFPAPPTVTGIEIISNTSIKVAFNNDLTTASATNTANYSGIAGLTSATVTSNGAAIDTVTLTFGAPFTNGNTYSLTVKDISNTASQLMPCPYTFKFSYATQVSFDKSFITLEENIGAYNIKLNVKNPGTATVNLEVKGYPFSTANASDFAVPTQTFAVTGTTASINVPVQIFDDKITEQSAEYFTVIMKGATGAAIMGDSILTVYIKDNDQVVPKAGIGDINLQYVGSFDPSGGSDATCEIVVHDSASNRLFTTSAITGVLDIIDFADPKTLKVIKTIDMKPYGDVTSVAVKNGIVAVASPALDVAQDGSVVFFNIDGVFQKQVTVGNLPDMITFTPDGKKVLTANEGQPNDTYTIDPEGSVSVIDISGGIANLTQANVKTIDFTSLNSVEGSYIASGVRKLKTTSTLSQDFEPEYITVSNNSQTAWVTLQENNAMAEIDLATGTLNSVWPLGTKNCNMPGSGLDASDNNNEVVIANWPVKSFFIPDAVANYTVNGTNYLVTANEGDEKEYSGLNERTTVGAANYILDPAAFPNAAMLKQSHNLGRLRVTTLNGDKDKDGDYDEIYSAGSRSFSIWNADTRSLVYDNGDEFEVYTSTEPSIAPLFNADNEGNAKKSRSRAKGPEAEGVIVRKIEDKTYAFITLERVGGVMVYDVTDPMNAIFVDYKNSRSLTAYTGDHGPEGLVYVPAATATGNAHVVVANEISGTLSVFEVVQKQKPGSAGNISKDIATFNVFPNPSTQGIVYFNRIADIQVTDMAGRIVYEGKQQLTLDITRYVPGVYTITTTDGASARLVVSK
ncbi:MAG: T9SS type A sorting domain-containing protein [Sphingobacteriales bacterium]|nr:MAG: T9SS type A sorting domain-containing protein [Sphingobacteriales bacterium]